jgi:hypothetical protein
VKTEEPGPLNQRHPRAICFGFKLIIEMNFVPARFLFSPRALVVLIFSLLYHQALHAEIYRWTDKNGQVHFSDRKPLNQQSGTETVTVTADNRKTISWMVTGLSLGRPERTVKAGPAGPDCGPSFRKTAPRH